MSVLQQQQQQLLWCGSHEQSDYHKCAISNRRMRTADLDYRAHIAGSSVNGDTGTDAEHCVVAYRTSCSGILPEGLWKIMIKFSQCSGCPSRAMNRVLLNTNLWHYYFTTVLSE
jgi:hypothetical protein